MEYSIGIKYVLSGMGSDYWRLLSTTLPERMMYVDGFQEYVHNNRVNFVEIFKLEE